MREQATLSDAAIQPRTSVFANHFERHQGQLHQRPALASKTFADPSPIVWCFCLHILQRGIIGAKDGFVTRTTWKRPGKYLDFYSAWVANLRERFKIQAYIPVIIFAHGGGDMNKILKYILLGTGSFIGVAVTGAVYLAATFNPNDYKVKIIQTVKETKQRDLRLDGDIKLSFFPNIGAELGKTSLSEIRSEKEFAAIENMRVSLALIPLLSRQVVVDEVTVSGLKATLVRQKDGSTNIDDLLGTKKKSATPAKPDRQRSESQKIYFDISAVSINKTDLVYRDEDSGVQYAIKDLNLDTGRIANNVPCQINLSVVVQANQPPMDIASHLTTTLTFDLDKQWYRLEDMVMEASGTALDISDLKMQASGDVSADLSKQEFTAAKFTLKAAGIKAKENFDTTFEAPALSLTKDTFSGEKLLLNAKLEGDSGTIVAAFSLPGLEGTAQSFKSNAFVLDVDVKQAEQTLKAKLSSPLSGNFKARQFNMNDLTLTVNASGEKLPDKSMNSELKGKLQVDATTESVQVGLAGSLQQSQVKAKIGFTGFTSPAIHFDVDLDQFDADLYLPTKSTEVPTQESPKEAEQPLDLSGLAKLNLDGSLHIGTLKLANVKSTQVRLDVKAHNRQIDVNPLFAKLYDGSMNGSLSLNAKATPIITINQNLTGINVAPLTKDAADFDTLEGKGDIGINLTMQGSTVSEIKKMMNGTLSLNLADGAIKGINIAKKLRNAQSMLGMSGANEQTQSADSTEKTDFSELKASFKVSKGIAHNDDLSLKSPLLRLGGAGYIDIGNNSMDYLAKATLVKSLKGQGGSNDLTGITVPVRAKGPFSDLKYTLDFGAMATEMAKQQLETRKDEVKTKIEDQLKESLQGLFK